MILLAISVSYSAQSGNIDSNTRWDSNNELLNDSLNVGVKNKKTELSISNSTVITKDYFSIATCNGNSSSCPFGGIEATVDISNNSLVGASVAIIGDASKGVLNVDNSSLYAQQLWVSGNDNDANAGSDDSNGSFNIRNKSKVYIISDIGNSRAPDVIKNTQWNDSIINSGNANLVDGAGKGDLILGKTGNGIINVDDSMMSVEKDLVVSTGVRGQPNAKPSEIHMDNNSTFRVLGDIRGGVSESGKLILTLDKKSTLIADKNISVGLGENSNVSIDGRAGSSITAGKDFSVSTGGGSVADIQLDRSSLDVKGKAVVGAGENSKTTFHVKNLSKVTAIKGMTLAEGNGTSVDMKIADSGLSAGNLSVGKGDHAQVGMNVSNSTVRTPGEFVVAKGSSAVANLAYTDSRI
ncbi:autotransporter outer membrane beta-barrel domain-containing protein, partial [Salmonella enterica]|nr:autotransporter outer membrane beta-barrel domain-containing protein [Salmonella enterica]EBN2521070.1 autotransporter outer membrane beta-barrel domain-containing protein [Salmonella enterica]